MIPSPTHAVQRRGQRAAAQPSSHRPPPEAVAVAADPNSPASSKLLSAGTRRQQPSAPMPGGWCEHAEQAEEAAAIQSLLLHAVMHIHVYFFFLFYCYLPCDIGYLKYCCMRFSAIRLFRGNPNPYPNFRVPKFRVPAYFGYTSGNGS